MEGECLAIGVTRGVEYGDSWHLDNVITTFIRATVKRIFGIDPTVEQCRLLIAASVVDLKDQRVNAGPWKHDNLVDSINYRALYTFLRELYERDHPP